ncbi:BEACH domain-containing protein C2 isoform X2 [Triticum aestivum]|uniref:BEACH domain-containing protein C2 isoform X2 n=1 Tax=Triticum aestivum TaxID=4565 RepID=UPI001D01CE80|nr:BEACH domain-containing protein C2-like isoform X2 [Triticum aestivum]
MEGQDALDMSDASPTSSWEDGAVEHFDVASFGGDGYVVDDEEMSDVELGTGSPAAPSEASTQTPPPLRRRLAPVESSDVPEEVVRAVDAVIMGGGVERLREMVSEENGEVTHFIVDVLMITMGGVDGLDEGAGDGTSTSTEPSIMSSSRAAAIAVELMPYLPCGTEPSPRTRMACGLLATLSACTRNRTMCSASGLLAILLDSAEKLFVKMGQSRDWDGKPLVQCIQVLGGHSVSVKDLHSWLLLVKKALGTRWATPLTLALEKAVGCNEAKGPAVTFEFDGESSGLLAPGDSRWPFSNGFGFATWIYVESFSDSPNAAASTSGRSSRWAAAAAAFIHAGERAKDMPRLFSFLTADNDGVEAYFQGKFLVVESGTGKGKKAHLHFTYEFKPQCWYFIGLECTSKQGLLGMVESELRLYVDDKLHESCPFEFPRVLKPLAFCCIGTNPPPTITGLQRQCPLFAEMGPIYIFMEPIGPERMARLASRGGDALPSFSSGAGLPWKASCDHIREMSEDSYTLDIEIGGSLHLLYHPSLLNGRFCPDASPSGSTGTHRRPAEVIGMVHISCRVRPAESLWALACGGPMALLPLTVSNIEMDNLEPILGDVSLSLATSSLSVPIFRIISLAIQHPGNKQELCRTHGPELLSQVLQYLLETLSKLESGKKEILRDEELVAAIVSLCQSQINDPGLKAQLFSTLLLDLKMWSSCNYVLQKKLLSSLADMVFAESACMYDANALQMLLDGCRRCYWVTREGDSIDTFTLTGTERPLGKVNALVDELLVVIELLIGSASSTMASDDVRRLVGFVVDCPQPNQVPRVLLLIYRLIVHPNSTRAHMYAQSFISRGGVEALLVLLQREAKSGNNNTFNNYDVPQNAAKWNGSSQSKSTNSRSLLKPASSEANCNRETPSVDSHESPSHDGNSEPVSTSKWRLLKNQFLKNRSGMDLPSITDNVQNNVYNIDNGDGVLVGIVHILGALVASGHLKFASLIAKPKLPSGFLTTANGEGNTMFEDRVSLLLFALQKAFQAAPRRLMTRNVYRSLISAVINISSANDNLNLYDSDYRFQHIPLLLVLLRSLPYASRAFQARTLQDLLFLVCSHPENRSTMTSIAEWPDWILEVMISNHEMGDNKDSDGVSIYELEDVIHKFLLIMLEHSMWQKDGWKDVEATIHCAEWLSMAGGFSMGDQRIRREEALPIFKRRLLGSLLDFSAQELRVQSEGITAAASDVEVETREPKIQAEKAADLLVVLAENAVVLMMLVEDHLRSRSQQFFTSCLIDSALSPLSMASSAASRSLSRTGSEPLEAGGSRQSLSSDAGGLPVDVLASMSGTNGQISSEVMERVTAAAAAEPYGSVRHAFVSYGSCISDLSEGWKYRSRLWYGVCIPSKANIFGGGGSGWEAWKSAVEKDSNGDWIELPLVKKSVAMLQTLLLDSGFGAGLGSGEGSAGGIGVMSALNQLLDSDQPFFCMLRLTLISMREDDTGEDDLFMRNISMKNDDISERLGCQTGSVIELDGNSCAPTIKPQSALLWRLLGPFLNVPVSESKRQRVLVVSSILYSEVWHAVSSDRKPLRKKYLGLLMPPYAAVLKRYRSVLANIHELASSDGENPLLVGDCASAADTLPVEAAVSLISPGWAAAFASPPVAMALAMIAAGASGAETIAPPTNKLRRRDTSLLERRSAKLHSFSSFQRLPDTTPLLPASAPKDKASAKVVALAAACDLEFSAKIGLRRGLSVVAMATSGQRRSAGDIERAQRWNTTEAMAAAWMECLQSADSKSVSGRDFSALSYKYVALLVSSFALARNLQRVEMERRTQVDILNRLCASVGVRAWRRLLHCLIETNRLYGPFGELLCTPDSIFWKLDFTECSSRMRRFMKRNYNGSDRFGAAVNFEEQMLLCDGVESNACHTEEGDTRSTNALPTTSLIIVAEAMSVDRGHEDAEHIETETICSSVDDQLRNSLPPDPFKGSIDSRSSDFSGVRNLVRSTAIAPGYRSGEEDKRIIIELPSLMVRPLKTVRGTFQVTLKRINFIVDEHTSDSDSYMDDVASTSGQYDQQDKDRSWFISSLHQIYNRRYLLRQSALELFMVDRSNFFFDFEDIEARRHAYRAIIHTKPPYLNDIFLATQKPEQILKQTQLMERWAKWEISNFDYLMELNTLAGRSYNDISQYPMFPWVVSDYQSKTLDLEDHSSYRDLSKPIGALNPARLKKFQDYYSSFKDPIIPNCHYGSHYSSPGTVLYYLARIEPFTTLSIELRGGKFGDDNHMLSDITRTWNSVLEDMNDVKELVPEMFYLPEVFTNVNSVDMGTNELAKRLGSVELPPWAENPVDFIHKHRKALESDHVSAHLHEWIDLIFGYKQRGKEAVMANNVFPYATYEGTVDIDKIADPVSFASNLLDHLSNFLAVNILLKILKVQRQATQDQIVNFGQTPSQLLIVPHIQRRPLADILQLQTIFRNPSEVRSYLLPNPDQCNVPASAVHVSNDCIVVVDANVPAAHVAVHHWQPNTPDGLETPFLFHHGKNAINSSGGAIRRIFKGPTSAEDYHFPRAIAFAASAIQPSSTVAVTCDKEVITGGHADNSVKLISSDGARTIETASGHIAPVTCLALSPDNNYFVTGSRDTTVILWRIHQMSSSHWKNAPEPPPSPTTPSTPLANSISSGSSPIRTLETSSKRRIEGPMHVLRGHLGEVTCCSVSSDLGLVASSSHTSGALLHSLRTGRLIRKLDVGEAHLICLSSQGIVLIWNESEKRLSTFTVNGIPMSTSVLSPFSGRVSCIEVSRDGQFALIAACLSSNCTRDTSTDEDHMIDNCNDDEDVPESKETKLYVHAPSICFIDLHKLEVIHTLKLGEGQDVTAVALNEDNTTLVASTADKQLIVFTNPSLEF